jgi:acyl-CoA thioester hydrolase
MTLPASTPHEISVVAAASDIDGLGHVNNLVYVRWIQEAAIAHWNILATPREQEEIAWVVRRHEIDYHRSAVEGDRITLRTWVGLASRTTFERHTEIIRSQDAQLLAKARTLWCPIDACTGRIKRVGTELRDRVSVPGALVEK